MTWWWARPLLLTAKGATITFGSTLISCALALQVEQSANRLLFRYMPHKYATVDRAFGLTPEQLQSVRHLRNDMNTTATNATNEAADLTTLAGDYTVDDDFRIVDGCTSNTLFSLDNLQSSSEKAASGAAVAT